MSHCISAVNAQRRHFWSSQITDCDIGDSCGASCHEVNLELIHTDDGATISTDNWVVGIAMNILLTDARREDTACGYVPRAINGHWSENFIAGDIRVGTGLRYIPPAANINESVALIVAYARNSLEKLMTYGVAQDVNVTGSYIGGAQMQLNIEITSQDGSTNRVAITAQRTNNQWRWNL